MGRPRDGPATGFLVKFKDGFSSPPHIHNITYRGIVISGQVHNDDPEAAEMWMPAGSYWTQPVGEVHITAAKGENNVAYIEIDSGPYLVQPPEESFDAGERPINVHADNIVWQDSSETTRVIGKEGVESPATYLLWIKADEAKTNASFLKLPARFEGEIRTHGERFRSVVVKGELSVGEGEAVNEVKPGSYFTNTGESVEKLKVTGNGEAILYIRNSGHYEVEAQ